MDKFISTKEQKEFIKDNVKGRTAIELTNMFNNKFKTDVTVVQIRTFKKNHKLTSGIDCRFKKGNIPTNKGTKGVCEYGGATRFKKGHRPHNTKPIGSESITEDGYTKVKVKEPNVWIFKQRLIYEKVYGKIPKESAVIFADGNKQNFDINNLILVNKKQLLCMMRNGLITDNSDLTRVGKNIADVLLKIREVEKKSKER